jgi:hypothetical protein
MEGNFDVKAMLDEAQKQFERQYKSAEVLKTHAQTILSAVSVIVTFFATLSTTRVPPQNALLFLRLEELIGALYILIVLVCIYALWPYSKESPIYADLETYQKALQGKDEREATKAMVVQYLEAMKMNWPRIQRRQKASIVISVLLPVIVVIIIWASLLPLMVR